jgi:hypothetical protein
LAYGKPAMAAEGEGITLQRDDLTDWLVAKGEF